MSEDRFALADRTTPSPMGVGASVALKTVGLMINLLSQELLPLRMTLAWLGSAGTELKRAAALPPPLLPAY